MPHDVSEPVYFIALLHVPDVDAYRREYGRKVLAQLDAAGAKLLVASPGPTVLEGEWEATWTVVVQFPSREAALRFYASPEYAPLKKLRLEELTTGGTAAVFDAYRPPTVAT
jgi:uncharacterized protein (DUF1330 family)